MTDKEITLEQVEKFMSLLTGEYLPEYWTPDNVPKMTKHEAFTVVYYLQEFLPVLPDTYEQCDACGSVFDSGEGGHHIDPDDSPDDYGGWYASIGVTQEMIEKSGGAHICCRQCDLDFWREKFPEWRAT